MEQNSFDIDVTTTVAGNQVEFMGLGCQMNEVESQFCISGPHMIPGSVRNVRKAQCVLLLQISLPARNDIIWMLGSAWSSHPIGSRTTVRHKQTAWARQSKPPGDMGRGSRELVKRQRREKKFG